MRIDFSIPVVMINPNEFKCYCKKSSMREVFRALKGDYDY